MWLYSCIRDLLNGCVHTFTGRVLHFVGSMTIDVKGKGCCSVAEVFRNCLHIIAVLQRGNGKAVSEVVESHFGNTDLLSDPLKLLV